ncbi:MAG: hypothetical protein H7A23_07190 [Leptospiraceae bacterium]|nr:hypothetical protein [Leptospiraceae bacterium]
MFSTWVLLVRHRLLGKNILRRVYSEAKRSLDWFRTSKTSKWDKRRRRLRKTTDATEKYNDDSGNDFHSYKGMLQAMWWAVPFRRLNTVYNIEKLITYHHQVNDGCGDYFRVTENGKKRLDPDNPRRKNPDGSCIDKDGDGNDYKDWGIGRLFVLLGNIPAVWV